jgi:MFS family permease
VDRLSLACGMPSRIQRQALGATVVHAQGSSPQTLDIMTTESAPAASAAPQLPLYLAGSAAWFAAFGVQQVLFTYIGAEMLHLPAGLFAVAQASTTLPAILLMLLGGAVADQNDTRRVMLAAHIASAIPPLGLAALTLTDSLGFAGLVFFGAVAGTISSFMMPAREAMLARVIGAPSPAAIQRAVRFSLLAQFLAQIAGMAFARTASTLGVAAVFGIQALIQLAGAFCVWRLRPAPPVAQERTHGWRGQIVRIREGLSEVWRSPSLLPVTILTFAIGVCFVGSFMVILPVILREDFGASVERVSTLQVVFWGGTIVSTLAIGAVGPIARKGRMIAFAITLGCIVLSAMSIKGPLWLFYLLSFIWGLGAGVTITMARTIVQEDAPNASRARILSVYQLGFTGGLPLGALLAGPIVALLGGRMAAIVPALAMAAVLTTLLARTRLWSLGAPAPQAHPG